jgi:hypothetical protein
MLTTVKSSLIFDATIGRITYLKTCMFFKNCYDVAAKANIFKERILLTEPALERV